MFLKRGTLLLLALLVSSNALADANLVAWWKFDEGSGTTAINSGSYSNTGTLTGPPTYSSSIPTLNFYDPYSLSFNGSSDYISFPNTMFSSGNPFTISLWVKLNSLAASSIFVSQGKSVDGSYQFIGYILATGKFSCSVDGSGTYASSNSAPVTDRWYHLAMRYQTTSPITTIFVDGVQQTTTASGSFLSGSGHVFRIGRSEYLGGGSYTNGFIDDVRIYNRALSAQEIAYLAQGNGNTTVIRNATLRNVSLT